MLSGLKPAVVVMAYNRPASLRRLLDSISRANYATGEDIPLVISIDRSEGPAATEVAGIAESFAWRHGAKELIRQDEHQGLVAHFGACGRLSRRFGAAIILEDDLTVAPPFYDFATQALARYEADPRIGGICLYGLWFNGFTHEPFQPIEDGFDIFFLRLPYTQGLAFTAAQWQAFEGHGTRATPGPHPDLPAAFSSFGPDEWFPDLAYHLVSTGRFFCFPRVSLTAGWGEAGAHFTGQTAWFQTPLQLRTQEFRLAGLDETTALYDSFYELLPERLRTLAPHLSDLSYDLDLNATKRPRNLHHDYVLTSRPVRRTVAGFGLQMYPPEVNVIEQVPGAALSLARCEDVYWDVWAGREARRRLHEYAWSRHRPSRRRSAQFIAARALSSLRNIARRSSES